jgi:hypothetical protein
MDKGISKSNKKKFDSGRNINLNDYSGSINAKNGRSKGFD